MNRIGAILIFLLSLSSNAATYYVATTGSDTTGNGSIGTPWLTLTKAESMATTAGDLVLVQPGCYTNTSSLVFDRTGTEASPITFRANGAVTNSGIFNLSGAWIVIDGFEFVAQGRIIVNNAGAAHCYVINCRFHDTVGTDWGPVYSEHVGNSTDIVISNNVVWSSPSGVFFRISGTNWTVCNNVISNSAFGGDFINAWGIGHVIRNNRMLNCSSQNFLVIGAGNPAYNGVYTYDPVVSAAWGGVWAHTNATGLVALHNNSKAGWSNRLNLAKSDRTIVASSQYGWTWTMHDADIVSAPTSGGAYINHPDFVQSWGPMETGTNFPFYPSQYSTNILLEGNWIEGANGPAGVNGTMGQLNSSGGWSNRTMGGHWTFRNNVFIGLANGSIDMDTMLYYNNTFYQCGDGSAVLTFTWNNPWGSSPRGEPYHCEVKNNAFIACGGGMSDRGWYQWNGAPASYGEADYDLATNCNNNYVCNLTNGWTTKAVGSTWGGSVWQFFEPNGINGGDPGMWSVGAKQFWLTNGALLINRGSNISSVTIDYAGAPRPMGGTADIGAYEFDPNLRMRLDFGAGISGKITDVTGYGHHAWQMDATNWITTTNGPNGLTAGQWKWTGTVITNDPQNPYLESQYAAITNTANLDYITNGTISLWVQWETNQITYTNPWTQGTTTQATPERYDAILDAGDLVAYAGQPAHTTNSFAICYAYPGSATPAGPVFKRWQPTSYSDPSTTLAYWTNQTRSQGNWWHIAVSWTGGGTIVGYENGMPFVTNALGAAYLEVGGKNPGWISLGAMQHSGTPQWMDGADKYPNAAWFKGRMADVRVYDRALSGVEMAAIYSGTGTGVANAPPPETPPETPPTPPAPTRSGVVGPFRANGVILK